MPADPNSPLGRAIQAMAGSPLFAKVGPRIVPPLDRFLHKASGGRIMLGRAMLPCVILTTTGRKSGEPRTTPLASVPYQGDLYVVGSNFGREHHPAWSWNLLDEPKAHVSFEGDDYDVVAELLDPDEKEAVWPRLIAEWPLFDQYVELSCRTHVRVEGCP